MKAVFPLRPPLGRVGSEDHRRLAEGVAGRRRLALAVACGLIFAFAPPSRCSAAGVHAVVDLAADYLLGGSEVGHWLAPDQTASRLAGGEVYELINLDGIVGQAAGGKPEDLGAPCEDTPTVRFPTLGEHPPAAIAVSGEGWALLPRAVSRLSPQSPTYTAVVRDLLEHHGIREPKVQIDEIVRADLDGDGSDEVIIAANRYAENPPGTATRAGDYAIVFVRRFSGGEVKTVILHEEYHAKAEDFGAGDTYSIAAIADLDGDGKMEIVVRGKYYEGEWTDIFQYVGGDFVRVIGSECGV